MQTPQLRLEFLAQLNPYQVEQLSREWLVWARPSQIAPLGNWRTWLMMGGRGAGKTRSGAEWLKAVALKEDGVVGNSGGRVALVGESFQDIRSVMIEGESGLLAVHRQDQRPAWIASRRLLQWPNGTIGQIFSANDPDGLRGNQFGAAWSDELCKWNYAELTFDMLQFCLRLGTNPRQLVTTTPKPIGLLKKLLGDPKVKLTQSSTRQNNAFLAPGFLDFLNSEYGGTRMGRQEIDGEILEDREDALWNRPQLEQWRVRTHPPLQRIVIAVDPPASSTVNSDACGIVAAGKDENGLCYVLADASLQGVIPEIWAGKVCELYARLGADCVVAEVNQGGDMVETILRLIDPAVPVRSVRASRGKWIRAEPVAMLYAKGIVRHAGTFPQLEDEMCDFGPDGLSSGRSPDRMDALVWALHELALKSRGNPRIRSA